MRYAVCRWLPLVLVGFLVALAPGAAPPPRKPPAISPAERTALATRAREILQTSCYRCHGQDGAVEGGLNFILDAEKLVNRRKVVPGQPDRSPLFKRVSSGRMPPPGEHPRPTAADVETLRRWIAAGAPVLRTAPTRILLTDANVFEKILTDLEKHDRRSRRFLRYFSLVPLANTGAGPDELTTHRNALAKLINSLSWHPRITKPTAIDPDGMVLRIDLRDYLLDANLWNRLLTDYPYGVVNDSAVARAVLVGTATRMPVVRADWFVATASRAPLYYDLLQIPGNLADLERQLRIDAEFNIRQERVARAGFNGSGISRNNRILERHDAMNGAYWRTYDFEAVPQNLLERNILLPDQRNVFAYPLGPGGGDSNFRHAGGEVIFNLPNGLQGYMLVNANNQRINKGPTEIVSDAKRPDRAVEAGLSCMHCHARGINPKDDQLRDHVLKNRKHFNRADIDQVLALYPPAKKMRALMNEDAERFRRAVEKTGNKVERAEVVLAMTLRYEADLDLQALAAEIGVRPDALLLRLGATENLVRNLGALRIPGGTVARQVVVQAFPDLVRELRQGTAFQPGVTGESLPDATGEADPLEAQSSPANAMAFNREGTQAAFASNDRSLRIFDVEAERDLRRAVGHTASVWAVAYSADGTRILSGSKDGSVRLWDVESARELFKLDGHADLVGAVAFTPDGKRALSAGYDHELILWDLEKGKRIESFRPDVAFRYIHAITFSPDGRWALLGADRNVLLLNATTGKLVRRYEGHGAAVNAVAFSADARWILSGSDDGTARLWDRASGKQLQTYRGHESYVKAVALSPDGLQVVTGGSDSTVRLWERASGKAGKVFRKHAEPIVAVTFLGNDRTLSGSRDGVVRLWRLARPAVKPPIVVTPPTPPDVPVVPGRIALRPVAAIPVGGTIGALRLTPDRGSLYYLNLTEGTVGRLATRGYERSRPLRLADGSETLALSPDGRWLVSMARVRGEQATQLQVIDPAKWAVGRSFRIRGVAHDLVVSAKGLAYLSGEADEWADVTAVDLARGVEKARWGGVWTRSLLGLTPDGSRLYISSQGVVPGTLDALVIPGRGEDRPTMYRAPGHDRLALGGAFSITPDGKYLLSRKGTVLRLAGERAEDMKLHTKLPPFLDVAVDPARGLALVLDRDGLLKAYRYPDFRLLGTARLGLSGYALTLDGPGGKLYVAGFDPAAVAERPRARGHGEIHVYDLGVALGRLTAGR